MLLKGLLLVILAIFNFWYDAQQEIVGAGNLAFQSPSNDWNNLRLVPVHVINWESSPVLPANAACALIS